MTRALWVAGSLWLATSAGAAPMGLAGTAWQLEAIRSMDDAQGTTQVANPTQFTLDFGRDGRATLRLDCNRGMGNYTVQPSADPASGTLTFGSVAGTRALCAPPHLDERILRDLSFVRSYLLKDGKLFMSLMADGGIYEWAPKSTELANPKEGKAQPVQFAKGKSSALVRGRITGRDSVDYTLRASAGQRLSIQLKSSNNATSFNLLPPESADAAMVIGEQVDHRFNGVLPDDGVYTVRVFLNRAAARRNERSDFSLTLGVTGAALKPLKADQDALLPNTPFHARTEAACAPAYTQTRVCEASVVRRGQDGTATVVLRWDGDRTRRILFIHGKPVSASVPQTMTWQRTPQGWRVSFNGDEHFDIPEVLVFGG